MNAVQPRGRGMSCSAHRCHPSLRWRRARPPHMPVGIPLHIVCGVYVQGVRVPEENNKSIVPLDNMSRSRRSWWALGNTSWGNCYYCVGIERA